MNKGDLIDAVAGELTESKANATRVVEAVLKSIARGVKEDGRVRILGFGSFERRQRPARAGVNPVTKEPMEIAPSVTVAFKPSLSLKQEL